MAGEAINDCVKVKERDGDLLEKTFYLGDNVVKVHERAIAGSVIGEITSLKCDSTVEYKTIRGTLNIFRISTEGNDFIYGRKAFGNADRCVTALKRSGIVEAIGKMTEAGCWNDISIEVSEDSGTNKAFAEAIPGSRAAETKFPPKR